MNKYRADIDGLRALAVIAVILYHAYPTSLPGGFVGVDVFFVISGYLITTIIYKEIVEGSFKLTSFYARRIRRIFPALLVLLFLLYVIGWYVLFPDEFSQLGKHILASTTFISNIIFNNEAGYFDNSGITKPLLHLWSLGVEEQYYLLWPVIIYLIIRLGINIIAPASLILLFISFSLNIYLLHNHFFSEAFYMPYSRFWELMAGSWLAVVVHDKYIKFCERNIIANIFSTVGILLLFVSFFFIDRNKAFPGWWALLPITGTIFLICFDKGYINKIVLSNKIAVFIGLISYPLYLFHWSIFSIQTILGFKTNIQLMYGIVISMFIAILVYLFIERKIRRNKSKLIVPSLLTLSVFISYLSYASMINKIVPRNSSDDVELVMSAIKDWEYPKGLSSLNINGIRLYTKKSKNKETVLFYGDSHIEQYAPRIVKLINKDPENTKSVIFATRGGVPPIPNVFERKHPSGDPKFKEAVMKLALSTKIDSVVIGWSSGYLLPNKKGGKYRYYTLVNGVKHYCDQEDCSKYAFESLKIMLRNISSLKKVYLLIDNPKGPEFDPKHILQKKRIGSSMVQRVYFVPYSKGQERQRRRLIKLADEVGIEVIDPVKFFCKNGLCRVALKDGEPIYKDSGHIRPFYAREYIHFLDKTIRIDR